LRNNSIAHGGSFARILNSKLSKALNNQNITRVKR
jgi:hypothetical protein